MDEKGYLEFRSRFPIFRSKVYLNSCSQGALSDAVESAMREYLESWNRHGSPWEHWVGVQEELRGEFAGLIGSSAAEVAVTFSASSAIYSVASAMDYRTRPKVVLGELEFPTQCHIWLAQRARGAQIEWVACPEGKVTPDDYRKHLDNKTVILPAAHLCFRNGFRVHASGLAQAAHENGAYILLDDYQSCGTRPVNVQLLGADFYVTGALKYLLGSSGVAFLYVRRELIERLDPTLTGWFAQRNPFAFDIRRHEPAASAVRFQSGTPPVPSVYAALAGVRLLKSLGLENVARRIEQLSRLFIRGAADRGWALKTPADSSGPLVVLEARDAGRVVELLGGMGIVVSSRDNGVRVSFHAYNTPGDVNDLFDALGRLEHHLE